MSDNLFLTSYKKNLGRNYMIIDTQNEQDINNKNFRIRMIHENNIPGLLNTHVQYIDDIPSFQYDITGLQSLEVMLETSPITYSTLCKLFSGIYNSLISLENYLLVHDHILLSPEYVYVTADYTDIYLCYYPLKSDNFVDSIRSFFDYLLKKVDHKDEKCVYLAYSMHRYCNDSSFNLNTLYAKLSLVQPLSTPSTIDTNSHSSSSINLCREDISTASKTDDTNSIAIDITHNNDCHMQNKPDTLDSSFFFSKKKNSITDKSSSENIFNINDNKYINRLSDTRMIFLITFVVTAILLSTILYIYDVYPASFLFTLYITIFIVAFYNGYHIYKQSSTDLYIPTTPTNEHNYNAGTVILSSSADENTHKLIYTGTSDGSDISISHFPFVIGKTDACSVKLQNSAISRLHAKLSLLPTSDNDDNIFLEDLNSTNGTLLNNAPLTPYVKYPITSGDYVTFGHLTYIFR